MKNQITDTERNTILEMHISKGYKTFNVDEIVKSSLIEQYTTSNITAVQNALINAGENVGPRGADGDYGTNTRNAVKSFQRKNGLKDDGVVGPCTAKALGVKSLQGGNVCTDSSVKQKVVPDSSKNKTKIKPDSSKLKTGQGLTDEKKYDCIGIDKSACDKLTSAGGSIGQSKGGEGCSQYMRVCLSQIDSKLGGAHAWYLLRELQGAGAKPIYNMFTSSDINYKNISDTFINKKINVAEKCKIHKNGVDADNKDATFSEVVPSFYPSSSKVNLKDLKKGDIVGMYWAGSHNFGRAFCDRGVNNGKVNSTGPYSFNTHVGFVGAIKDGEPLIFHSVGGNRKATPASKLLKTTDSGMIVWVVRDKEINDAVYPNKKTEPKPEEKAWYDITKYF